MTTSPITATHFPGGSEQATTVPPRSDDGSDVTTVADSAVDAARGSPDAADAGSDQSVQRIGRRPGGADALTFRRALSRRCGLNSPGQREKV